MSGLLLPMRLTPALPFLSFLPIMPSPYTPRNPGGCVLEEGEHNGFSYAIIHPGRGTRCGYVRVPSNHPLYGVDISDLRGFQPHGGFTYSAWDEEPNPGWWVGFDCAHAYDLPDPELLAMIPDSRLRAIWGRWSGIADILGDRGQVRSQFFVRGECVDICDYLFSVRNQTLVDLGIDTIPYTNIATASDLEASALGSESAVAALASESEPNDTYPTVYLFVSVVVTFNKSSTMGKQLITVGQTGQMFGLQHKKGKGLDLRRFGPADINRITLIEWEEKNQAWFIRWSGINWEAVWTTSTIARSLPLNPENGRVGWAWFPSKLGLVITCSDGSQVKARYADLDNMSSTDPILYFRDYEEAVSVEITVVQAIQSKGSALHGYYSPPEASQDASSEGKAPGVLDRLAARLVRFWRSLWA